MPALTLTERRRDPLQALPVELAQEIFFCTVTPKPYDPLLSPKEPKRRFQSSALTISAVSRRWRNVALSTPELWSHIFVQNPSERCIDLLNLYLTRAGTIVPLQIMFKESTKWCYNWKTGKPLSQQEWEAEQKVSRKILDLLVVRMHRWRSIDFELDQTPVFRPGFSLPRNPFPQLKKAALRLTPDSPPANAKLWSMIHHSQNLEQVTWLQKCTDVPPIQPSTLFQQLTHVTLPLMPVDESLALISYCTRIQHLTLSIDPPSAPLNKHKPILIPNLSSLQIDCAPGANADMLLAKLITPKLQSLKLDTEISDPACLTSFIQRSSCTLRQLIVKSWIAPGDQLAELLRLASPHLTALEKLDISVKKSMSSQVLRALTPAPAPDSGKLSVLLPSLLDLRLGLRVEAADGLISDMLLGRRKQERGLSVFSTTIAPGCGKTASRRKDLATLQRLAKEEGLVYQYISADDFA